MKQKTVKVRKDAFRQLLDAAQQASDWLCDAPLGSDQQERGDVLRIAIQNAMPQDAGWMDE